MKILDFALVGLVATVVPALAADHGMGAASDAAPFGAPVDDVHVWYHALLDQLEGRLGAASAFHWEGEAWAGTDSDRVRFKSEGTVDDQGHTEDGRYELLYDRPITSFFDIQGGLRTDADSRTGRTWAALGVEGLAPLFLHVSATGYASSEGHFAGRLEGSYDLLVTQRLILQPQIELNLYSKADPRHGLGSGLANLDTGLRLRYEISRKFAPYIGLAYERSFGDTAGYGRAMGDRTESPRFTLGVRAWL